MSGRTGTPVLWSRGTTGKPAPRWDGCPARSGCERFAIRKDWPGWSCAGCWAYQSPQFDLRPEPPAVETTSLRHPSNTTPRNNPNWRSEEKVAKAHQDVLAFIRQRGGACPVSDAMEELGLSRVHLFISVNHLVKTGQIQRASRGVYIVRDGQAAAEQPAPSEEEKKEETMPHDHNTPISTLCKEIACAESLLRRKARALGFEASQRTAEQHRKLVEVVNGRRRRKPSNMRAEEPEKLYLEVTQGEPLPFVVGPPSVALQLTEDLVQEIDRRIADLDRQVVLAMAAQRRLAKARKALEVA